MAILRGLRLAAETGLTPAILESDALSVVNKIGLEMVNGAEIGVVINDIYEVLRRSKVSTINFVPRLANSVAHSLAKLALASEGESMWLEDCPLSMKSLFLGDCPYSM
ncbi:hypothetical protein LWI29_021554 [Acer saccharum]|uniref:RNase H type-1 domain-containing protein n=1 Tax=Acer saccharum TaxID=4024 RepID=A0AA39SPU5_ACESA|nr:hypothetical protein LWI29_021554 [Acer saccharum]